MNRGGGGGMRYNEMGKFQSQRGNVSALCYSPHGKIEKERIAFEAFPISESPLSIAIRTAKL